VGGGNFGALDRRLRNGNSPLTDEKNTQTNFYEKERNDAANSVEGGKIEVCACRRKTSRPGYVHCRLNMDERRGRKEQTLGGGELKERKRTKNV